MRKDEKNRRMVVRDPSEEPAGGEAISLVLPVRSMAEENATLLLVRPLTGRTHQIRAQLAARGFPLVGDSRYGTQNRTRRKEGLKLHSARLTLPDGRIFTSLPPWPAPWNVESLPDVSSGRFDRADCSRRLHEEQGGFAAAANLQDLFIE
jgi:hypothetical protein